jgi:SCP-2 sterol transfer family
MTIERLTAWSRSCAATPIASGSAWSRRSSELVRWAIQIDSRAGKAGLLEPAPLDAELTIHIGLAEWVRVVAGIEGALTVMLAGRCNVEGDTVLAMRQEAMFGGR